MMIENVYEFNREIIGTEQPIKPTNLNITKANCPYSVLKSLKKYYEIEFEDTVRKTEKKDMKGNTKYVDIKFRTYTIINRKDKDVKESNIWREGQVNQLSFIFMGESIS